MKLIFGGHWAAAPEGWTALKQADQDITKRLNYADGSVDAIFTEHVIEHVTMQGGIAFMREAHRVLKPGGVLRCVAPMTEALAEFDGQRALDRRYANDTLRQFYEAEHVALGELGLGLEFDPHPFLIDSLVRKHGHLFVWSAHLMVEVLHRIGFSEAQEGAVGESVYDSETALERRVRGIHEDNMRRDLGADAPAGWDCESGVVEARK